MDIFFKKGTDILFSSEKRELDHRVPFNAGSGILKLPAIIMYSVGVKALDVCSINYYLLASIDIQMRVNLSLYKRLHGCKSMVMLQTIYKDGHHDISPKVKPQWWWLAEV